MQSPGKFTIPHHNPPGPGKNTSPSDVVRDVVDDATEAKLFRLIDAESSTKNSGAVLSSVLLVDLWKIEGL